MPFPHSFDSASLSCSPRACHVPVHGCPLHAFGATGMRSHTLPIAVGERLPDPVQAGGVSHELVTANLFHDQVCRPEARHEWSAPSPPESRPHTEPARGTSGPCTAARTHAARFIHAIARIPPAVISSRETWCEHAGTSWGGKCSLQNRLLCDEAGESTAESTLASHRGPHCL